MPGASVEAQGALQRTAECFSEGAEPLDQKFLTHALGEKAGFLKSKE